MSPSLTEAASPAIGGHLSKIADKVVDLTCGRHSVRQQSRASALRCDELLVRVGLSRWMSAIGSAAGRLSERCNSCRQRRGDLAGDSMPGHHALQLHRIAEGTSS